MKQQEEGGQLRWLEMALAVAIVVGWLLGKLSTSDFPVDERAKEAEAPKLPPPEQQR